MVAAILAGMIGSGVYDIAYQLGTVASPGGAIVAWAVCFVGMLLFVLSLQNLLEKEPEGDGMFCYAQKLFGPLGEFMSGWGYWISGWGREHRFCHHDDDCPGDVLPRARRHRHELGLHCHRICIHVVDVFAYQQGRRERYDS